MKLIEYAFEKRIEIELVTKYCFQGNGVIGSSNKNLIIILRKTVIERQNNFYNELTNSLWADQVTAKEDLCNSPYFCVYRQAAILPSNVFGPYNWPSLLEELHL